MVAGIAPESIAIGWETVMEHAMVTGGDAESATDTENETGPLCVGVPEIAPERESNDNPAGSCPEMDQL